MDSDLNNNPSQPPESGVKWKPWFYLFGFFAMPNLIFGIYYLFALAQAPDDYYEEKIGGRENRVSLIFTLPEDKEASREAQLRLDQAIPVIEEILKKEDLGSLDKAQCRTKLCTVRLRGYNADEIYYYIKPAIDEIGLDGYAMLKYGWVNDPEKKIEFGLKAEGETGTDSP